MSRYSFLIFLTLGLLLFFIACDDNNDITGPADESPDFPSLELQGPETSTTDEGATIVSSFVSIVNMQSGLIFMFFSPEGAQQTSDGWEWSVTYGNATMTLIAQHRGDGSYEWLLIFDGTDEDGTTYDNWVAMSGVSSGDGNFGSVTYFYDHTTDVLLELEWNTDSDGTKMAEVTFYKEDNTVESYIQITNTPDGAGSMDAYETAGGELYRYFESEWYPDGTGWWIMFNESGEVTNEGEWV